MSSGPRPLSGEVEISPRIGQHRSGTPTPERLLHFAPPSVGTSVEATWTHWVVPPPSDNKSCRAEQRGVETSLRPRQPGHGCRSPGRRPEVCETCSPRRRSPGRGSGRSDLDSSRAAPSVPSRHTSPRIVSAHRRPRRPPPPAAAAPACLQLPPRPCRCERSSPRPARATRRWAHFH